MFVEKVFFQVSFTVLIVSKHEQGKETLQCVLSVQHFSITGN